ncbi:hypothetical protein C8R45DRAFT_784220, partial [Mycena sanguinolenta]
RRMVHASAPEYHVCELKLCIRRLNFCFQNIPFDYSNRKTFAVKCIAYMGFGFALPFVAVGWQW